MKISEVISSMSSAIIPIVNNGSPESMIFAAGLQPLLSTAIDSILLDIFKKGVTKKETMRLGISYKSAVEQANENLSKGLLFRQDNMFISSDTNYSKASDIIEATINSIIIDTEYEKSKFYGYFIGNLGFCPEVDYTNGIHLQNIIKQLTFTQLCIIKYFYQRNILSLAKCNQYIENSGDIKCMEIYFGFKELNRFNLLKREPPFALGNDLDRHSLNANGKLIYKIMSLHKIKDENLNEIHSICERMGVTFA